MPRSILFFFLAVAILSAGAWLFLMRPSPSSGPLGSESAEPAASRAFTGLPYKGSKLPVRESARAAPPARMPSAANDSGLDELEAESSGRWVVKENANGFVTKMSEGRLSPLASTPEASARTFLERFGRLVFGFPPESIGTVDVIKESETSDVVVSFAVNGLPVFGARHKQTYDVDGNLIYVLSDSLPSRIPDPVPIFSREQAAAAAREGLLHYLGEADRTRNERVYALSMFIQEGRLMYRLVNGALSLVYRYEFPLATPDYGDMEAMIDANLGTAVVVQRISRN